MTVSSSAIPVTVLALDDDYQVAALLGAMLRFCGYNAITVVSGREALQVHESVGEIAVFVTEARMVGESGLEIASALRRRQPNLPILFLSGVATEDDLREVPQPWRFLPKPFMPSDLKLAMQMLFDAI